MATKILDREELKEDEIKCEEQIALKVEKTMQILKEPRSNLIIGCVWVIGFAIMGTRSVIVRDFRTALWCIPFGFIGMIVIISYLNFCIKYNDTFFIFRDALRREYKFLFEEVEWFKDVTDYWEFKMPNKQINLTVNVVGLKEFIKNFPEDKKQR